MIKITWLFLLMFLSLSCNQFSVLKSDNVERKKGILINAHQNILSQIKAAGLWIEGTALKLHLGCGEQHFDGYINIDYPPADHTVQTNSAADVFANITQLKFPAGSVDEIRSHHFFEHFDRQVALALLCNWYDWLNIGGIVTIETPDFWRCVQLMQEQSAFYANTQYILRHIFGSHEAFWAYHYDGWYEEKFRYVLGKLGFQDINVQHTQYLLLANIIVMAAKKVFQERSFLASRAKSILRDSMVNNSTSEELLWHVWCRAFDQAFDVKA